MHTQVRRHELQILSHVNNPKKLSKLLYYRLTIRGLVFRAEEFQTGHENEP